VGPRGRKQKNTMKTPKEKVKTQIGGKKKKKKTPPPPPPPPGPKPHPKT